MPLCLSSTLLGRVFSGRQYQALPRRPIRTGDDTYILDGAITVTNLRGYAATDFTHSETKAAGPDGQPCQPHAVDLLRPHTVQPEAVLGRIGKETNRATADTDLADTDEPPLVYSERLGRGP